MVAISTRGAFAIKHGVLRAKRHVNARNAGNGPFLLQLFLAVRICNAGANMPADREMESGGCPGSGGPYHCEWRAAVYSNARWADEWASGQSECWPGVIASRFGGTDHDCCPQHIHC